MSFEKLKELHIVGVSLGYEVMASKVESPLLSSCEVMKVYFSWASNGYSTQTMQYLLM